MGVIINRPTEHTLGEAITSVPENVSERLYWGGPVQQRMVLVLHRHADDAPGTAPVSAGMALGTDHDALLQLLQSLPEPTRHVRVYSGYAGWAGGQLEAEMNLRSWIIAEADPELVFDVEPDAIWGRALEQLGPRYAYLTTMPSDPRVN